MAANPHMAGSSPLNSVAKLASYQRCVQRIQVTWPAFLQKRQSRLHQQERHGVASEKVAENILEDLFTEVLDWDLADLNNQLEYADLVLSKGGMKYLIVEVKRPGILAWNQHAVEKALAVRYAGEQRVSCALNHASSRPRTMDTMHQRGKTLSERWSVPPLAACRPL